MIRPYVNYYKEIKVFDTVEGANAFLRSKYNMKANIIAIVNHPGMVTKIYIEHQTQEEVSSYGH